MPSGQDNKERGEEVHKEKEGEIEHWNEDQLTEEWEHWEFVGEDDVEEDQEYEEDEENDDNARIIYGDAGHQVCCLECTFRLKIEKKRCAVCRKKNQAFRGIHFSES